MMCRLVTVAVVVAGLVGSNLLWGDSAGEVQWGYEGDRGPAHWGSLDAAFSTCGAGTAQSPIDLAGGTDGDFAAIEFDYGAHLATVVNTGHTIQVNVDPGSGITLGGTRYELLQFHFHHGSEHTVGGVRLPMEMHLVHRSDRGALAVVGVLLGAGAANEALAPIWERIPSQRQLGRGSAGRGSGGGAAAGTATAWRYRGSLTTPPCTEGVAWIVMSEPVTLSAAQIAAFGALYARNYRPVQPLGRRTLGRDRGTRDA